MYNRNIYSENQSLLIDYLVRKYKDGELNLPSIQEMSQELGISVSSLREQLGVIKSIGLIDAQPRTGIRLLKYQFKPAVEKSLRFATLLYRKYFYQYSELRNHIERAYFIETSKRLSREDIEELQLFIDAAKLKLNSNPIQIPHQEHKDLHLLLNKRLGNVFVMGIWKEGLIC